MTKTANGQGVPPEMHERTTTTRRGFLLPWLGAWSFILALSAACGGSAPAASPPATPSATPASAAPEPAAAALPTTWSKDMPKEQQLAFMKKNVLPAMGPAFKAHDAARYADFGCKTCHGPAYKNPHEFLPKLTLKDGKMTAFAEKPEVSKFMAESVVPKMAAAMGLPPYDVQTHQGFGCAGCHDIEMK
jgi:cytochrome c551/c552